MSLWENRISGFFVAINRKVRFLIYTNVAKSNKNQTNLKQMLR